MSAKETAAMGQLLGLLEARYAIRVLWALRDGHGQTFRLLQDSVGGITPNTLNTRLKELREAGLVGQIDQNIVVETSIDPKLQSVAETAIILLDDRPIYCNKTGLHVFSLPAATLGELVARMNELPGVEPLDLSVVEAEVTARDREVANRFSKDGQITAIRGARAYLPDRVSRVVAPHRLTDPKAGPLIAVKLHVLTRKTLGGLETDLDSRVLGADGEPIGGLYAAGEVAGFGGGGVHGYRSLEGTFVGGCIFSGRAAGRGAARQVG